MQSSQHHNETVTVEQVRAMIAERLAPLVEAHGGPSRALLLEAAEVFAWIAMIMPLDLGPLFNEARGLLALLCCFASE